ncbi:sugar ABC transporter permease [Cohnella sp. GbtcB17]|uniref:ABC transporter permease n=1 Tax=Cohnella sp. GbtcB17 TaxID=2824762 RepID=UPI001C30B854|nr:ABC transporter permease subunit [Cohnella sp. GbtcB17]
MVIPALIFIFIFSYVPMYGIVIAFKDYDIFQGLNASPWVGLDNFKEFLRAEEFRTVMRNTLAISFLKLVIGFPAPILLALMLNEVRIPIFKRIVQTISYLPHFLSWVIVSGFVLTMLSSDYGSLNIALEKLHLIDEPVNWLTIPNYFWGILIATGLWKGIGFGSIVYLAAISGVNPDLYEAADIDGAGRLRKIFSITLPCILPVVSIFLILAIGDLLSAGFEDILLLQNDIVRDVSDVLDTYVYRIGIKNSLFSYAAAVGLFKAVISVVLLTFANALARRSGNSLW